MEPEDMMKSSFIVLALTASLFLAGVSHGEDWKEIMKSQDGQQTLLVDKDSIRSTTKKAEKIIIRTMTKIINTVPEPHQTQYIDYSTKHYEWDCDIKQFRIMSWFLYYTDGTNKMIYDAQARQWTSPVPGSFDQALYEYLCKK